MRYLKMIAILAAAGVAGGCGAAKAKARASAAAAAAAAAAAGKTTEAAIHGHQFAAVAELRAIPFDYDADRVTSAGRELLKSNAAAIKLNSEWEVLVEGHCDQRGTVEYNLALGQRRAKAIRDYYVLLGIPGGRIATLSYGAEKLSCPEATEACWARNRRAESKVKTSIARKPR